MRNPLLLPLLAIPLLFAGGCVWVKMEPRAQQVRVVDAGQDLSGCQRRGEVAVAVKDGVGFVSRNALKVRDELETLARNEAVGLGADTVQAKSEPVDGQQRFLAFSCGGAVGTATTPAQRDEPVEDEDGVQVFRLE